MTKCFCDICKIEIVKDSKHYALAVREHKLPYEMSETQLYLEDVCYACFTDIVEYVKRKR